VDEKKSKTNNNNNNIFKKDDKVDDKPITEEIKKTNNKNNQKEEEDAEEAQLCTLYIKNLSFDTDEKKLERVFSNVGKVRRVTIGRAKELK
jgi:RNA recognition motif-containing protein